MEKNYVFRIIVKIRYISSGPLGNVIEFGHRLFNTRSRIRVYLGQCKLNTHRCRNKEIKTELITIGSSKHLTNSFSQFGFIFIFFDYLFKSNSRLIDLHVRNIVYVVHKVLISSTSYPFHWTPLPEIDVNIYAPWCIQYGFELIKKYIKLYVIRAMYMYSYIQ